MLVQYSMPVHFLDDNRNWVEYDNSMHDIIKEDISEGDDFDYENVSNDIKVKLSKFSKENNMFKIKSDNFNLSWGYINSNKSQVEFINNESDYSDNDKFIYSEKLTQEAVYNNIYDNVDLQCFITPEGVKENIILNDSSSENEFMISYKTNGLNAVQESDSCILLKSGNEVVYTINAPFAQDANGIESKSVNLSIAEQNNNKLNVNVSVDDKWLNSGEVAFPVIIDPEISVGGNQNTVTSALLSAQSADTPTSQSTYFFVGGSDDSSNINRGIVRINNLPELKNSDRIINAGIRITPMNELPDMTIYSHEITTDWNTGNATWNSIEYNDDIIDYNTCENGSAESLNFDITKTAKKWYDGSLNNYGVLFESNSADTAKFGGYQCNYNEKIPILFITYKNFDGTESNLSYHNNSIGANTTTAICDYTGNMLINQTVSEGTGSRMPVSISASYSCFDGDKVFANGSPCGYGWQLSFNKYIAETSQLLRDNGYDYVYTDGDGTEHYFKERLYESDEESPDYTEWEAEELGFTLWFDDSFAYMTDGSGVETKYDLPQNGGKILSEKDENNNQTVYSYSDGNLNSITDGAGRVYTISYSVNTTTQKREWSKLQFLTEERFALPIIRLIKISYLRLNIGMPIIMFTTAPLSFMVKII